MKNKVDKHGNCLTQQLVYGGGFRSVIFLFSPLSVPFLLHLPNPISLLLSASQDWLHNLWDPVKNLNVGSLIKIIKNFNMATPKH